MYYIISIYFINIYLNINSIPYLLGEKKREKTSTPRGVQKFSAGDIRVACIWRCAAGTSTSSTNEIQKRMFFCYFPLGGSAVVLVSAAQKLSHILVVCWWYGYLQHKNRLICWWYCFFVLHGAGDGTSRYFNQFLSVWRN